MGNSYLPALTSEVLASGAGGYLQIDLQSLVDNYATLQARAPNAVMSSVIKADAYGLGVKPVTQALYAAGCRTFFVALVREAFNLRDDLPTDARLYVLNGVPYGSELACTDRNIIPVLNCLEQVRRWNDTARTLGRRLSAALQVDTGMSRLGMSPQETDQFLVVPADMIDITLLMSHLACADEPANLSNADQLKTMEKFAARFPNVPVSFANSGGIFLGAAYHHQLVRPGLTLYGGAPFEGGSGLMKSVVSLHVAVIQTRSVPAGTHIGYGGTYVAGRDMRLATIAAGYADGLPRSLSNRGAAWFGNVRLPILGRVSMDSTILDISALEPGALPPGSFVELIGPHQSLEALAADAGTIPYEILTRLGTRYYRHYLPQNGFKGDA